MILCKSCRYGVCIKETYPYGTCYFEDEPKQVNLKDPNECEDYERGVQNGANK